MRKVFFYDNCLKLHIFYTPFEKLFLDNFASQNAWRLNPLVGNNYILIM